ncbi:MAG: D-glycero-beta-D-manno-heptose 1-phosphate adenylyltransferase [Desulfamplus sp.]|nr:D-glycero-beta-D-manno-heptose 1-phosphate adenylyltransferase [Desulfamplus sp.]MBF0413385.1 D-glycero-beta-D-manno-heptose 1-phosphate adenylyltransferase [Desulfamplus sp.]
MKKINNRKIVERSEIKHLIKLERDKALTVVFTNGCFDIIHAGHVTYLQEAANQGDILIIGLNSDISVRQIKGDKRPIVGQMQRVKVLAALECVDYVVLFDEPDPENLIKDVVPDVLVKGADWSEKNIIGADFVKSRGGRVERIELVPEISTTTIIERIIMRYGL